MLRALVTTVIPRRSEIARATSVVVVPPVSPTTAPSATRVAASAAIRRFSAWWRAALYRRGSSYRTSCATAPPCVRESIRCSSRSWRSRRTVAAETPRRSTSAVTSTVPSAARASSTAATRSVCRIEREHTPVVRGSGRAALDRMLVRDLVCPGMSAIAQEVESQPACWKRAAELAAPLRDELGAPGRRVAIAGCGTSLYVARAFAALREASGKGETDAFPASEFPSYRSYDRVVAISRSGTTTEVVQLLERLGDVPRTVVTADASSPVASLAETTIALDFADERSVVQTRFATSALALFRAHLGQDLGRAVADGERALTQPLEPEPTGFEHVVFLGHGWTVGIAEEAALKLREATQTYSEAYPAMEYRHGPISLAGERSLVWILGSPDPAVADDVRATGATVRVASLDPMAELVLVHRMAIALAEAKGLDPDHPAHLTRSVVLPS